ncbi:TonB-dependent receptor family protein [Thalassolituus sp.]|uniref:TonB-dependent receptor family protein n=1 Tax=Thalassolituus sp. TaxID=2030822 RepID=UPI0035142B76
MIKRILALLLLPAFSIANDVSDLEEIVVIGSTEDVSSVPGSGLALNIEQLERYDHIDLHQIMAVVPGVYTREEDGFGLRPNIGIRGAAAERSQKITIMEDGVLITPAPYSAPAAYYVPNVSRMNSIEVLKGPSAIRQGPQTVAGAINFVTRPVPDDRVAVVDVSAGTDNFYKAQASYGDRIGETGFIVDIAQLGSDGFKDLDTGGDTGFVRSEVNLKIQQNFDTRRKQQLTLKLGWADEDADETYLGLSDEDFKADSDRRYAASQLARFQSDHLTVHVNHGIQLSENLKINTKAYWHEFNREWNKLDGFIDGPSLKTVLASPNLFQGQYLLLTGDRNSELIDSDILDVTNNDRSYNSMGLQVNISYAFDTGSLIHDLDAGIRYHYDEVDRNHRLRGYFMDDRLMVSDGVQRGSKVLNHQETDAFSFYIADVITYRDLEITVGARYEDIEGERLDKLTGIKRDSDQDNTSFGIGALWHFNDNVSLLAGVYEGFSPASPGSLSVEPEETVNYEYGARYEGPLGRFELIGFFSDYDNLIGRCRVSDADCNPGDEFNGGSIEIAGAEFSGAKAFTLKDGLDLELSFNYTYTESAFQESFLSGFSQWGLVNRGDELPYLPEHMGRVQLGLIAAEWQIYASVRSQSEMREEPGRGDIDSGLHAEDYSVVDISATVQVNENWEVQVLLQNALDEEAIVSHRPFGARPNKPFTAIGRVKYSF